MAFQPRTRNIKIEETAISIMLNLILCQAEDLIKASKINSFGLTSPRRHRSDARMNADQLSAVAGFLQMVLSCCDDDYRPAMIIACCHGLHQ
jgi:hypothetical protein